MEIQEVIATIENPERCNICDKDFATKSEAEHQAHAKSSPFHCEKCGKTFERDWNRRQHIKIVHVKIDKIKSFECPECDEMFGSKGTLKDHLSNVHEKRREYHRKKVHTKSSTFKCEKCDKTFSRDWNRSQHVKIVHSTKYSN